MVDSGNFPKQTIAEATEVNNGLFPRLLWILNYNFISNSAEGMSVKVNIHNDYYDLQTEALLVE